MISQTPSSALPSCRLANPRGLARAKALTPATARPEIRLTVLALVPPWLQGEEPRGQSDPDPGDQPEHGGQLGTEAARGSGDSAVR